MKKRILAVTLLLAACAAKPESIQPAYVSPVTYDSWTCPQLAQESARVESALATASKQQQAARDHDTAGILFLGLPTGSMSGEAIAPEVARLKGSKEAIQQSMTLKSCGLAPPPAALPPGKVLKP
jgi:hypothetical protein